MRTSRLLHRILTALALSACFLATPSGALAQINPEIANCRELKDEATVTQADLCSAHIGCRFVLNVQKTCARAKSYLERLQTAIGEGTKTLFGQRKEVTPDAVFTAVLNGDDWTEQQHKLGGYAQAQQQAREVSQSVRKVGSADALTGSSRDNATRQWVYYGQASGGKPDGIGTRIYSDGEIHRGQTQGDTLVGVGEVLSKSGSRFVGKYSELGSGQREGTEIERSGSMFYGTRSGGGDANGTYTRADGSSFMGQRDSGGARVLGRESRADGSLAEEGRYEGNRLSAGARYDTAGARTVVNLSAERAATARAAADAEQQRKRDEEQRQREAAVQAEQQFRASLQTMNPGQLFAKADELNAQGDRTRAREVQRTLMSRFPNHTLTATVARQMTGESGGGASVSPTAGQRSSASATASAPLNPVSKSLCVAEQNRFMDATLRSNAYFKGDPRDVVERLVSRNITAQIESFNALTAEQLKSSQVQHEQTRQLHLKNLEQAPNRTAVGYTVNPELTGAELGLCIIKARLGGGGSAALAVGSGSVTAGAATSARLSSQQCEAMKQTVMTTRVPRNASVTASQETVMFMTKTVLDMIDGGCPTDGTTPAQIEAERQERMQQYAAAESACNAVQSGGRRCVPQAHASAGVNSPPAGSAANTARQSEAGYDPVTGKCLPEGSMACKQIPSAPSTGYTKGRHEIAR